MIPVFQCGIDSKWEVAGEKSTLIVDFYSLNVVQLKVTQTPGVGYRESSIIDIEISDQGGTIFSARWDELNKSKEMQTGGLYRWTQKTLSIQFEGHTEMETMSALFFCLGKTLEMISQGYRFDEIAAVFRGPAESTLEPPIS